MNRRSCVITALAIGLLVTGCSQGSGPKDEAESYAMKACGIEVSASDVGGTDDAGGTEKYVYPDAGGATWSKKDSLTDLEELETTLQNRAQNAAQANRLDSYWDGLAEAWQEMYSHVNRLIQARKEFNVYLGWNGKDWPQKKATYKFLPDPKLLIDQFTPPDVADWIRVAEDVDEWDFIDRYPWVKSENFNEPFSTVRITCGFLASSFNAE
jgi:hypothetical protein